MAGLIVTAVQTGSVTCEDRFTGAIRLLEPVDTVVLGMGQKAERSLYDEISSAVPELHAVGDCVSPRLITDAIADGERAGWML